MKDTMQIEQTMSSREIAELTGKDHADVLKDIRRILEEVEIDHGKFSGIYKDSMNRGQTCYHLPRRECDLIVSGYSVKYRLEIIDRWQELEHATQVIADALEMEKEAMLKDLKLDATIEATKATIEISKAKGETAKARGETAKLKLQALKDKLVRDKAVLESKAAKLISQGAKIKGDMTVSKLSMPTDTITNLLLSHGSKLTPAEANNALVRLGYLSPNKAVVTSTGSYYGTTIKPSPKAKTSVARWYVAEFGELLPILSSNK